MERASLGDRWAFGSRHPHWIRRRRGSLIASVTGAIMLFAALTASGAEVVTAEVTGTTNDVTVTQGSSTTSTINILATGAIACTITSGSPSTATVDTSYALSSSGALTASTPSAAMDFYSNGVSGGGSGNCGVTWSGAPTPYSVTASFSAAATTPVGAYNVTLVTAETNPGVSGGKLGDTTATTVTVHVVAPPDTTPPVITPNVSGTLGNNGWYTNDVTVSWTVSDPDSSISSSSGCGTTTINTDTTGTTLTCTATSAGGTSSQSATIKRDATAPTGVVTTLDRASDLNGWYNEPVGWTTTGTDATSGIASCSSGTYSGPDGIGLTVSGTCIDNAGNTSAPPASSAAFKYDNTDPTASVTGVSDGSTYILGSVPIAGCDTQDSLSGVQTPASLTMSGSGTTNPNGVGSFTATCSGATDNAGNSQAAPVSASYSVIYDPAGFSGILQPINPDNTSLFSRGKAVPVKFRLGGDEPNGFDYSGWTLQRIKVNCTNFDTEEATLEAVAENPSNAFRYDAGADQYINNASFKDQAAGTCWKVKVTLDSGQTMESAIFRLQK